MSDNKKDRIIAGLCIQLARATIAIGNLKDENRKLRKKVMKYEGKEEKKYE